VKTLVLFITAGISLLVLSVGSTLLSSTDVLSEGLGREPRLLIFAVTVLVVGSFLTLLFRISGTGPHLRMRRLAPGAFALAIMWQGLQYVGARYVERVLVNTSSMTQTFGLVLGLLGFLYIGAVMAVLSVEVNVVIALRLFPRALLTPFTDRVRLTEADRRAYARYAAMQRHKGFQTVNVRFGPSPADGTRTTGPGKGTAAPTPGTAPVRQEGEPGTDPPPGADPGREAG
jgi:hypothetical protein